MVFDKLLFDAPLYIVEITLEIMIRVDTSSTLACPCYGPAFNRIVGFLETPDNPI
jgi:hypothetical protein